MLIKSVATSSDAGAAMTAVAKVIKARSLKFMMGYVDRDSVSSREAKGVT